MKTKKIGIVVILSLIILAVIAFAVYLKSRPISNNYTLLDKLSIRFFDKNKYKIDFDNVNCRDININWTSESDTKTVQLYKDCKFINSLESIYGKNIFEVFYKEKPYFRLPHFKTNHWNGHNYNFHIVAIKDTLKITFKAIGNDSVIYNIARPL